MNFQRSSRKIHKWVAVITAIPLLVIFASGVFLSLSSLVPALQPKAASSSPEIKLSIDEIMESARGVPEAGIKGVADVSQIDIRPARGIIRVRAKNYWEIQIDGATGAVVASAPRMKTWLITVHDGTWFGGETAKYAVFLPAGISAFALWLTGLVLFVFPWLSSRKGKGGCRHERVQVRDRGGVSPREKKHVGASLA